MAWRKRARLLLLVTPLLMNAMVFVPGCGESGDPLTASDGTPLKRPSEILKEAQAKNATLKKVTPTRR